MTDVLLNEQATEAQNQPEVQKLSSNKEIIAYLAEKFPLCFSVEGEAKPLKIGLFQDLAEALQDDERVSKTQLRHALRQYTSNWRYLHGCRLGAERVDLQGNPSGVLEQEHVEHAARQLTEAKAKFAEKRAAERAAGKANRKKRQPRKSQTLGNKTIKPNVPRKSKIALTAIELATLQAGQQVKIKAGNAVQSATVLEVAKDSARVQLENGLTINVSPDRLFA
ncbi:RNA chaperone ProQ [Actinobacillus succinogenes]|uniref:RNA chaperone ProQ n=1 Tax=Actinobacillus succinogenes (strain ATCC 55618 / DSM 22257 / CCUG 43843 / 130Z) TaxID=339671 RepID=A6VNA2_ACTSZ|nr:RNA chaperone ProQ [Actinobacillus succinogenes]ABR74449.1 ProQ activator of osmoprotectant transporter ProP [Actinobacillus succinogenes 130Z]PHI41131.1 RNA chaperone ProQ [Actinobacillus succinogenes]